MSQDWIPTSDADFNAWIHNLISTATANKTELSLTTADLAALQAALDTWDDSYPKHISAQAAARSATQTKSNDRDSIETLVRPFKNLLQAKTSVTDSQREALGLPVQSPKRTAVSAPTTRPVAQVDTSQRLRHTISFADESTPNSRAKPAGVSGCEIWMKVGGPAPIDPAELTYLATDTRTPYVTEFAGADSGKTAYYMVRWVNTRNERGPWGQTVSGTITN